MIGEEILKRGELFKRQENELSTLRVEKQVMADRNARLTAALVLTKGLCQVRDASNDEVFGYRDPMIAKILEAIERATS